MDINLVLGEILNESENKGTIFKMGDYCANCGYKAGSHKENTFHCPKNGPGSGFDDNKKFKKKLNEDKETIAALEADNAKCWRQIKQFNELRKDGDYKDMRGNQIKTLQARIESNNKKIASLKRMDESEQIDEEGKTFFQNKLDKAKAPAEKAKYKKLLDKLKPKEKMSVRSFLFLPISF